MEHHRPLAPATGTGKVQSLRERFPPPRKKHLASVACEGCRRRRARCDEQRPRCQRCIGFNVECVYRPRVPLKDQIAEATAMTEKYELLVNYMKTCTVPALQQITTLLRDDVTMEDMLVHIRNDKDDEMSSHLMTPRPSTSPSSTPPSDDDELGAVEGYNDSMADRPFLLECAKPWTTVTDDYELISHLISLFILWDQTSRHLLDANLMLEDMVAGRGDFCSELLVNAVLAVSCHYSNQLPARADPFNTIYVERQFFEEAMRLWHEESEICDTEDPKLTTVQAGLILVEVLGGDGLDFLGGPMLDNVLTMSKRIGLDKPIPRGIDVDGQDPVLRKRIEHARSVTSWGLFHIGTTYS